jgi:hypothetical protein
VSLRQKEGSNSSQKGVNEGGGTPVTPCPATVAFSQVHNDEQLQLKNNAELVPVCDAKRDCANVNCVIASRNPVIAN